jgi:hypothetical protein
MRMSLRIARHVPAFVAGALLLGALAWPFLQPADEPPPVGNGPSPTPGGDGGGGGGGGGGDGGGGGGGDGGSTPDPNGRGPMTPAHVTLEGGRLLVDGAPSPILRCVGFQPVPVGVSPAHGYRWAHFPENYEGDLPLLAQMGANAVAVNTRAAASPEDLLTFMDRALDHGIRVILVLDGPNRLDLSDPEVRRSLIENVTLAVEAYREHPALLAWQIGIEVDYTHRHTGQVGAWYALLEEATREAHALDPHHPVLTASNPVTPVEAFLDGSPSVDVYGINFYGLSREGMSGYLTKLANDTGGRPVLVAEFGVDAYDNATGLEDVETQARVLAEAWSGIQDAHDAGVPVLGGCVHEWSDQWWKGGDEDTHDPTPTWPTTKSGVLPDDTFSEEWFGLVALRPGELARDPRPAYERLRELWTVEAA